jgi:hypothetical protein
VLLVAAQEVVAQQAQDFWSWCDREPRKYSSPLQQAVWSVFARPSSGIISRRTSSAARDLQNDLAAGSIIRLTGRGLLASRGRSFLLSRKREIAVYGLRRAGNRASWPRESDACGAARSCG